MSSPQKKLYSEILTRGNAEEEVEGIRNAIDDESDVEFDSHKYNECFMNIYGFSEYN